MIRPKEPKIIVIANQTGILLYRVIKPSINPAIIKKGIVLTTIFKPSLAPFKNETRLEYVFGNKMLFPITNPAQPAITITDISIVPCSQIVFEAVNNKS